MIISFEVVSFDLEVVLFDLLEDVFELSNVSVPEQVGLGELLVRIKVSMVHPCDIGCASGLVNGVELPAVGGFEGVGIVEKVGTDLQHRFFQGLNNSSTEHDAFGAERADQPGHSDAAIL